MPGRHSLDRDVALNALTSPVGRSAAAALVAGTIFGVALPAAQADEGSAAGTLAPVNEVTASAASAGTEKVTASASASWSLEQVASKDAVAVSEQTKSDLEAEAAAEKAAAEEAAQQAAAEEAAQQAADTTAAAAEATTATTSNTAATTSTTAAASTATTSTASASDTTSSTAASAASTSTAATTSAGSATGSAIVATALSYVGAPYVWGGTTPSGWDCIGFVRWVYAQYGVSIGGYTTSVLSVGRQVPYSQAQPGDILYWQGHVAIYVGNGQNVGAWNPSMGTQVGPNSWIGTPTVIRVFG